ncbi:hypothetical protein I5746_32975, partial [Burkholderia gladioli]|nr:hypothetical protein [Burkholderia gladioli]
MIARPSRRPATQPGAAAHPGHPRASRSRRGPVAGGGGGGGARGGGGGG